MTAAAEFGARDRADNLRRLIGLLMLVAVLGWAELIVGADAEREVATQIIKSADNWASAEFLAPDGYAPIPVKRPGTKRILYISNSHAKTGGHVARHLQRLLDQIAPAQYEVLDLADPGIFAPDMLQRGLAALAYQPDVVVLSVAYISFADRMKLSMQAKTARSFLKRRVFPGLSPGFWLRNYELGTYGEAVVGKALRLYGYRNQVRAMWQDPLTSLLRRTFRDDHPILSIEQQEYQAWRFPDGYDRNLFQWNLYAAGRRGHLADLRDLVGALTAASVPSLAFNLPIDFDKSTDPHSPDDYRAYRASLRSVFEGHARYMDLQDFFPVEFSTYDALHPIWGGARLHALEIVIELIEAGLVTRPPDPPDLLSKFEALEGSTDEDFGKLLQTPLPPPQGFRRYDLTEPNNARGLLGRLAALPPDAYDANADFLLNLSLRIRYWLASTFPQKTAPPGPYHDIWDAAIRLEMIRTAEHVRTFRDDLVRLQLERIQAFPLPDLRQAKLVEQRAMENGSGYRWISGSYRLPDDASVTVLSTADGTPFMVRVVDPLHRSDYQRVDLLGDGSFLMLGPGAADLPVPGWLVSAQPLKAWGY